MDIIEFRGQRIDNGEWVYGCLIKVSSKFGTIAIITEHHSHFVVPESVGQFTWKEDENGANVFTGDIVKYWGGIGVVVRHKTGFFIKHTANDYFDLSCPVEIIGKIHNNPELFPNING